MSQMFQYRLRTLFLLTLAVSGGLAVVSRAASEDRLVVAFGLIVSSVPVLSGVALVCNAGQSRIVSLIGWLAAVVSLAVLASLAFVSALQAQAF
jgi:hypothetical protein